MEIVEATVSLAFGDFLLRFYEAQAIVAVTV